MPNPSQRKELSDFQKGEIIVLHAIEILHKVDVLYIFLHELYPLFYKICKILTFENGEQRIEPN